MVWMWQTKGSGMIDSKTDAGTLQDRVKTLEKRADLLFSLIEGVLDIQDQHIDSLRRIITGEPFQPESRTLN